VLELVNKMDINWGIRQAEESEVELYLEWADNEGWIFSDEITRGYYKEFPRGWFLCELNNETSNSNGKKAVIGLLFCTKYRSNIGFVGYFMMDPEYRGQGYGEKIFQDVLQNYLFAENSGDPQAKAVGLFAMESAVPFYIRHGFKTKETAIRFKGSIADELFQIQLKIGRKVDGIIVNEMTGMYK